MSEGYYYSSKKTDDICEDVCGQVFFSQLLLFSSLIFVGFRLIFQVAVLVLLMCSCGFRLCCV